MIKITIFYTNRDKMMISPDYLLILSNTGINLVDPSIVIIRCIHTTFSLIFASTTHI